MLIQSHWKQQNFIFECFLKKESSLLESRLRKITTIYVKIHYVRFVFIFIIIIFFLILIRFSHTVTPRKVTTFFAVCFQFTSFLVHDTVPLMMAKQKGHYMKDRYIHQLITPSSYLNNDKGSNLISTRINLISSNVKIIGRHILIRTFF